MEGKGLARREGQQGRLRRGRRRHRAGPHGGVRHRRGGLKGRGRRRQGGADGSGRRPRGESAPLASHEGPGTPPRSRRGRVPRPKRVTAIAAFRPARVDRHAITPRNRAAQTLDERKAGGVSVAHPSSSEIVPSAMSKPSDRPDRPKRFYKAASLLPDEGGFAVALDGRGGEDARGRQARRPDRSPGGVARRRVGGPGRARRISRHARHAPGLHRHRPHAGAPGTRSPPRCPS